MGKKIQKRQFYEDLKKMASCPPDSNDPYENEKRKAKIEYFLSLLRDMESVRPSFIFF